MLIEVVDCTSVNASDSPNIFCIAPINGGDGTPITFEMSYTTKTKTIVLKGAVIGTRSFIFVIFAKWSMALIFQVGRKKFTSLPDCNITMNLNCSEVVPSHFPSLMAIFYFRNPHSLVANSQMKNLSKWLNWFFIRKFKDLVETTDDYALEPPMHRNLFGSSGGQVDVEGKCLQPRSSITGKTCVHVNHSGPRIYIALSTSAFHRPHVKEIYYEIVAYRNELQKIFQNLFRKCRLNKHCLHR